MNEQLNKPLEQLRHETREKHEYIEKWGIKVVSISKCEFAKTYHNYKSERDYKYGRRIGEPCLSKREILTEILDGRLFGLVQCDVEVPAHLHEKYAKFPSIFKNVEVGRDDIGEFMAEHAKKVGKLSSPRKMLISSYLAGQMLLTTPIVRWYAKQGFNPTTTGRFWLFAEPGGGVDSTPPPAFLLWLR